MRLPDGAWSHDCEVPCDDEAVGVAGEEPVIAADEYGCLDACLVASQDG